MSTNDADAPTDRRVRRTRRRLEQALLELVAEKRYDRITVQDLVDRADIGRSTFYAHFDTKDDLLLAGLDHLTADLQAHMADDPAGEDAVLPTIGLFRHIAEQHHLFAALLGSRGIDLVTRAGHQMLARMAREGIEAHAAATGQRPAVPPEIGAVHMAGSLMALIQWWLGTDMARSPEQMAHMFHVLVTRGVTAVS